MVPVPMKNEDPPFVCPETHAPVRRATDEELVALREALGSGKAKRRDGGEVPEFEGAWMREDGDVAYLVIEGIPNFLVDERLEIAS